MTKDEMVGRHHRRNGLSLSRLQEIVKDRETYVLQFIGLQRLDTTEQLNNT